MYFSSLGLFFLISLFIAYHVGLRSNISKYQKSTESEINQYKTFIHHLSDAMHNLGSAPLREKSDINQVFLSPEDAEKIRALFRILRQFSTGDLFKNTKQRPPYQEITTILDSVVMKDLHNPYNIAEILAIEQAALRFDFNEIKTILDAHKNNGWTRNNNKQTFESNNLFKIKKVLSMFNYSINTEFNYLSVDAFLLDKIFSCFLEEIEEKKINPSVITIKDFIENIDDARIKKYFDYFPTFNFGGSKEFIGEVSVPNVKNYMYAMISWIAL